VTRVLIDLDHMLAWSSRLTVATEVVKKKDWRASRRVAGEARTARRRRRPHRITARAGNDSHQDLGDQAQSLHARFFLRVGNGSHRLLRDVSTRCRDSTRRLRRVRACGESIAEKRWRRAFARHCIDCQRCEERSAPRRYAPPSRPFRRMISLRTLHLARRSSCLVVRGAIRAAGAEDPQGRRRRRRARERTRSAGRRGATSFGTCCSAGRSTPRAARPARPRHRRARWDEAVTIQQRLLAVARPGDGVDPMGSPSATTSSPPGAGPGAAARRHALQGGRARRPRLPPATLAPSTPTRRPASTRGAGCGTRRGDAPRCRCWRVWSAHTARRAARRMIALYRPPCEARADDSRWPRAGPVLRAEMLDEARSVREARGKAPDLPVVHAFSRGVRKPARRAMPSTVPPRAAPGPRFDWPHAAKPGATVAPTGRRCRSGQRWNTLRPSPSR